MIANKILAISVMQNWGGGEEFLLTLCKTIQTHNFIIASPYGKPFEIFSKNKLRTYRVNSLKKIYRGKERWSLGLYFKIIFNVKISTLKLLRLSLKEKPCIILANGLFAALYVLPLVILLRKRFILVQHLIFDQNSIEKRILGLVYKRAEKIICVSNAVKNNVLSMLKKNSSPRIIVIPNAVAIGENIVERQESNQLVIGMVGSIIRIKGIHLVIEALKSILKNKNVLLYLYGTTVEEADSIQYFSELNEIINEMGLSSKVFFKGYRNEKEIIYSSVDIVINYSTVPESFSFTVLEAMSFKKIVISSDAGGPKEIIKNGENGFLVETGHPNLLEKKVEDCIENYFSEYFKVIRENAYITVKNNYSLDKFKISYTEIFGR